MGLVKNKNITFYLLWNRWKEILITIFILLLTFFLYTIFNKSILIERINDQNQLKGETIGKIININIKSGLIHDLNGSKLHKLHYEISYIFYAKDEQFTGINNIKNLESIIYKNKIDSLIYVKYSFDNPNKSLIKIGEKSFE